MRIAGFIALCLILAISFLVFSICFAQSLVQLKLFESKTESFMKKYNVSESWISYYRENVEEPIEKILIQLIAFCLLALVITFVVLVLEALIVRS